jgi:hypothetical protein
VALAAPLVLTTRSGARRLRALSLDSIRAAAAAAIVDPAMVIPAHYGGWAHFGEGRDDLARAFDDAGLTARLRLTDHGPGFRSEPRASPSALSMIVSGTVLPAVHGARHRAGMPGRLR